MWLPNLCRLDFILSLMTILPWQSTTEKSSMKLILIFTMMRYIERIKASEGKTKN